MNSVKNLFCGLVLMASLPLVAADYQLPNPGFEQQGGSFNGDAQPASWNGSNVSQVGFDFTFLYWKNDNPHSGSHYAYVADKEVGAMGITEVGPGYFALGTPWSYLEGLSTGSATAGTEGGIAFTARPDTLSCWIKRDGSHGTENANIVFYSWRGTAKSSKYKNKSNGCTSTDRTDEESDIRLSTDWNECGTDTPAEQVAEGWYKSTASYSQWTNIRIPITYYNNLVPEKCNVIFSAGNYPNFRANSGLYANNSLSVDDVELIYSSKIHELRFDGLKYRSFNTNKLEYTYDLDKSATSVPTITCFRSGRQLSGSEITIKYGKIGETTTITVKAEDGSSTTTYKINFVYARSSVSTLSGISVNGTPLSGFNKAVTTYNFELPYGTAEFPTITYTKDEDVQTVEIVPCELPGTAKVICYAENPEYSTTYNIKLTQGKLTDTSLKSILCNGVEIDGFTPAKTTYTVNVPVGTTESPELTYVSAYADGEQTVTVNRNPSLDAVSTITVSAPGVSSSRTYKISYNVVESSYSYLKDLKIGGETIEGFAPATTSYSYSLPVGTSALPAITYVQGDAYQTVTVEEGGVNGVTKIVVKAQNGINTSIYRITFATVQSSNNKLKDIKVGGVTIDGFDPETLAYTYRLPIGTASLPAVSYVAGDAFQTISEVSGGVNGTYKIIVKAQNGSVRTYQIAFSVEQATVSTLNAIFLDGTLLDGFDPSVTDYNILLPRGTVSLPEITYTAHDAYQKISKVEGGVNGTTKITVKAQSGAVTVYNLNFSVESSSNSKLKSILVGGVEIADFNPLTFEYSYTLASGTSVLPEISVVRGDEMQKVTITKGGVNGTTRIKVVAENGDESLYTIAFTVEMSANAALKDILIGGVSLADFDAAKLNYVYILPESAVSCPSVDVVRDGNQIVEIIKPELEGDVTIKVTPETGGSSNIYTVKMMFAASSNTMLADIALDGVSITEFNPMEREYDVELPVGTTSLPTISYTKIVDNQIVEVLEGGVKGSTIINVVAENGDVAAYTLNFSVVKSSDASLASILVNGVEVADFESGTFDYSYQMSKDATTPVITFVKGNAAQVVELVQPALDGLATLKVTAEDGTTVSNYSVSISYILDASVQLNAITLDGSLIDGFEPTRLAYSVNIPYGGSVPEVDYVKGNDYQNVMMTSFADSIVLDVIAEDGANATYRIDFVYGVSSNALLSTIQVFNTASKTYSDIAGFESSKFDYTLNLALGTADVPTLNAVAVDRGAVITITYSADKTNIHVVAGDGITTADYVVNTPVERSSETSLYAIYVGGEEVAGFDPDVTDYNVVLPAGTSSVPAITYDKADIYEQVALKAMPLNSTSTIKVTAQNGSERTYNIKTSVAVPSKDNTLVSIFVNDNPLDGYDASSYNYNVTLPYGISSVPEVTYVKSYSEQTVLVERDGFTGAKVTVKSNVAGVADAVYTLKYSVCRHNNSYLSDIKVNGTSIAGFSPDKTKYIVNVSAEPTVSVVVPGSKVDYETLVETTNHHQFKVVNTVDDAVTVYDVFFHYTTDVIPNNHFTSWSATTYNNATKPTGWMAPADAAEKLTVISTSKTGTEVVKTSNTIVGFETVYWSAAGGALPAVLTLGTLSETLKVANGTTNSVSGGITFRNTPEYADVNYYHKKKAGDGVLFQFDFDKKSVSKNITATNSAYETVRIDLGTNGMHPSNMNITINATNETSGASAGARLYVDYINFVYSSAIRSISVNGIEATIDGTSAEATIATEAFGLPVIDIEGQVSDQQYDITYGDEVAGVRAVTIKSIAEDGSNTTYNLTVRRALSDVVNLASVKVGGTVLPGFAADVTEYEIPMSCGTMYLSDVEATTSSSHATVAYSIDGNELTITATAETGATRNYVLRFVESLDSDAELASFAVAGYTPAYDAENDIYSVVLNAGTKEVPAISFVKKNDCQVVELVYGTVTSNSSLKVTSSDGSAEKLYNIAFQVAPIADSKAQLAELEVVDASSQITFDAGTYDYQYARESVVPAVAYSRAVSEDAMVTTITDDSVMVSLGNSVSEAAHIYKVRFIDNAEANSLLSDIIVNGASLEGFDPHNFGYTININRGASLDIVPVAASDDQSISTSYDGSFHITVTAVDGSQSEYVLDIVYNKSTVASLSAIKVGGELLDGFASDKYDYSVVLPVGTVALPEIEAISAGYGAAVVIEKGGVDGATTITVTSEDGNNENTYTITFSVAKSDNSKLARIDVAYVMIAGFSSDVFSYSVDVAAGESDPVITYQKAEVAQTVEESVTDASVVLTVTAEDGIAKSEYVVNLIHHYSSVSNLASLMVDGVEIDGFASDKYEYSVVLPEGSVVLPPVTFVVNDNGQDVEMVSEGVRGDAQITVTAGDGVTKSIYTIHFSVEKSGVATLDNILLDDESLASFEPDKFEYVVDLPCGTKVYPTVTYQYSNNQTVTSTTDNAVTTINVVAENGIAKNTYVVTFNILKSDVDWLSMIVVNDEDISTEAIDFKSDKNFDKDVLDYTVRFDALTELDDVHVTYRKGYEDQIVDAAWNDSVYVINVTAETGSKRTYNVKVDVTKSVDATLADLLVGGATIEGFDPAVTSYEVTLPQGTKEIPDVSYEEANKYQTINKNASEDSLTISVEVTAQAGNSQTYTVVFNILKSDVSSLSSITFGNEKAQLVPTFDPEILSYKVQLPNGTVDVPETFPVLTDANASYEVSPAASLEGNTTITVTAENGTSVAVYTLSYEVLPSSNADLAMIYVNGDSLSGFDPEVSVYEVTLPFGTTEKPVVSYDLAEDVQTASSTVEVAGEGFVASIEVSAEDGNKNEYTLNFLIAKSSENHLASLSVFGKAVDGFDPEITEYSFEYPPYTDSTVVPTVDDIAFSLVDAEGSVAEVSQPNASQVLVSVTAADGSVRNYIITTTIEISDNTSLEMIYIKGNEIQNFDPATYEYYYKLPFGTTFVNDSIVTYLLQESGQDADIQKDGMDVTIIVYAQDEVSYAAYVIHFVPDTFDPSVEPGTDDVCITSTDRGTWKFTTRCNNVTVILTDLSGRIIANNELKLVDQNCEDICSDNAEGFEYAGQRDQLVIYYFVYNKKKAFVKGKFRCLPY